jgi:hypothetical protein
MNEVNIMSVAMNCYALVPTEVKVITQLDGVEDAEYNAHFMHASPILIDGGETFDWEIPMIYTIPGVDQNSPCSFAYLYGVGFNFEEFWDIGPPENWSVDSSDYVFSGELCARVFINSEAVDHGVLAAFVDDECRGVVESTFSPQMCYHIFSMNCYSNLTSGETLTFKLYNSCQIFDISETVDFVADMSEGSATNPLIFNTVTSSVTDIEQYGINIYPNPSKMFNISFNNAFKSAKIFISDVSGKIVYWKLLENSIINAIDLSDKAKGVYFISIIIGEKRFVSKLIVE